MTARSSAGTTANFLSNPANPFVCAGGPPNYTCQSTNPHTLNPWEFVNVVVQVDIPNAQAKALRIANGLESDHFADAIHVAGDQMPPKHVPHAKRTLQIHGTGSVQPGRAFERFTRHIELELLRPLRDNRQAGTLHAD